MVAMLLRLPTQEGIRDGRIDLVFRRWRRPTVKAGGRLRCAVGELAIIAVEQVEQADIDDAQAVRAGFGSAAELIDDLFRERAPGGRGRTAQVDETSALYRVRVAYAGVDERAAKRETLLDADELAAMVVKLSKMDERSDRGDWTRRSLQLIATWPGRRAPELAAMEGQETVPWKSQIRRLKELGLTESLKVGYRLSPRGKQVLETLITRK
jgi:hypothetical protein